MSGESLHKDILLITHTCSQSRHSKHKTKSQSSALDQPQTKGGKNDADSGGSKSLAMLCSILNRKLSYFSYCNHNAALNRRRHEYERYP